MLPTTCARAGLTLLLCLRLPGMLPAQSPAALPDYLPDDPALILEVGAAMNWDTRGGAATYAPEIAAEFTPVERWLEVEAGTARFHTPEGSVWSTDVLLKKPWTLRPSVEFMAGLGPEWDHQSGAHGTDTFSLEVAGDFMFWPSGSPRGRHRFGWYLEPAASRSCTGGHPWSLELAAGLLVGVHRR